LFQFWIGGTRLQHHKPSIAAPTIRKVTRRIGDAVICAGSIASPQFVSAIATRQLMTDK